MAERRASRSKTVRVAAVLLVGALAFCWMALLTYNPSDWPAGAVWPEPDPPSNACGAAGAWFAHHMHLYLGKAGYLLLLLVSGFTVAKIVGKPPSDPLLRAIGTVLVVTALAVLLTPDRARLAVLPHLNPGGVVGVTMSDLMQRYFSNPMAMLLLVTSIIVGLLLAADEVVMRSLQAVRRAHWPVPAHLKMGQDRLRELYERIENVPRPGWLQRFRLRLPFGWRRGGTEPAAASTSRLPVGTASAETITEADTAQNQEAQDASAGAAKSAVAPKPVPQPLPVKRKATATWPTDLSHFELPPLSLLPDGEPLDMARHEKLVQEKARILEQTLQDFKVDARIAQIDTGPVITIFELDLAAGVKVSQITSLSNDIARVLRAPAVRVVAPIPGKNTVGIEVPNMNKGRVRLKELIIDAQDKVGKMALPLYLGRDASGDVLTADLAAMPHLLIAGTTGSGKSVCINSIIMAFLMMQRPDHVKLILVDPKMVEMAVFAEVPHLMSPIITDMQQAALVLDWAATKMDERYELLAEAGVRNLTAYNRMSKEELYAKFGATSDEEKAKIPLHMPYIVIIIDELADVMMMSGKEVEFCLSRLAQKSRAVGVHIILATQRPQANVVTGLIKSNLPCRIGFRVASRMDSRIVLDQNGAEVLMGQGDMLFLPPGSSKLIRAQGCYVDDAEVRAIVDYLKGKAPQEFHQELINLHKTGDAEEDGGGAGGPRDPLFDQAARIVIEAQRGSVSLLQRRLTIGYGRAARLIDQMAEAGIVGGYKGSQAREVIMTMDEWDAYCAQQPAIAADLAHDKEVFEDEPESAN
jgi:S-DNA-T family DNA segregation ATPase FtsK/SpoIIIE